MRKGTCSKCNEPVEESRMGQRYCMKCHAEHMRLTRPKHSQLREDQRKKANARSYAKEYIRRGLIEEKPCEVCGEKAEAHHDDYDKPKEVRWFCRKHHLEHHYLEKNKNYLYDKNEKCND